MIFLFLLLFGTVAQAVGLVDDTVSSDNLYSAYPLANYKLDFYVDTDWDWLPWNWKDGLGNQVQYGLYAISDFLWTISLYLSNATGYLIQQSYKLDFISDTANQIGENIQILAGVSENGFSTSGFYVGFLLLFILIVGAYVAYVGLIKRETSKAIQAGTNFVVVFLLSAGFIAYAPSYIQRINEFSSDISQASLDLGSKIILPHVDSEGKESVDLIRDTLFSVQVEQPWLLLQFDNSDKEEIGESRVNALLEVSPETNNGKDREEVVKTEIEDQKNQNLTLPKTVSRLGTVVFLVLFNIGISIFVFLLTGIMIFSQILFILYAMFLPISFLLSMLPTFTSMGKSALMKLFNTIMLRAGITLIITAAFSLSTMIYTLTTNYPFFLIAFLQIVTFAGIYLKLGDIMTFFHLQASDSQQVGRSVFRRPKQYLDRGARRLQRTVSRTMMGGTVGYLAGKNTGRKQTTKRSSPASEQRSEFSSSTPNSQTTPSRHVPPTRSYQRGQRIGKVLDSKNRAATYVSNKKQQVKEWPQTMATSVNQTMTDFKQGISDERTEPVSKKKRPPVSSRSIKKHESRNVSSKKNQPRSVVRSSQQQGLVKKKKEAKRNSVSPRVGNHSAHSLVSRPLVQKRADKIRSVASEKTQPSVSTETKISIPPSSHRVPKLKERRLSHTPPLMKTKERQSNQTIYRQTQPNKKRQNIRFTRPTNRK
ncbi:MFS transporter [Enterococcus gallinarum]|uniref:CD3337/EF1877 family mobilome membrane protein n=1 Tax=Enterococcus gallinarum TaxID=1353 RepID=UPI002DC03D8F|nr:YtxH domain-containing protein [Enterococcus gallinarum]MEB5968976.1 MFS transporter [Enterococcus gallinarum]